MVLRNWYNLMKANRAQQILTEALTYWNGSTSDVAYRSAAGIEKSLALSPTDGLKLGSTGGGGTYSYIVLGSGTTPATVDDYKLENQITSGLTGTTAITVDEDNDAIYVLTLTNTSSEDITIGEVGIFASCFTKNSSSSTALFLLERTVLDAPITIPAGGIGTIDYSIKLPIPTT